MGTPNEDLIKDLKTLTILGLTAGISYAFTGNSLAGHLITAGVVGALANYMHNVGQERRIGSNIANVLTLGSPVYNAYRNISNGGDKMFNDARNFIHNQTGKPPQPPASGDMLNAVINEVKTGVTDLTKEISQVMSQTHQQVQQQRQGSGFRRDARKNW